jgi:hypothetical protein
MLKKLFFQGRQALLLSSLMPFAGYVARPLRGTNRGVSSKRALLRRKTAPTTLAVGFKNYTSKIN